MPPIDKRQLKCSSERWTFRAQSIFQARQKQRENKTHTPDGNGETNCNFALMLTFYGAYVIRCKSLLLVLSNTHFFPVSPLGSFALLFAALTKSAQNCRRAMIEEERNTNCMNIDAFNDSAMVIGFGAWFYYMFIEQYFCTTVCIFEI